MYTWLALKSKMCPDRINEPETAFEETCFAGVRVVARYGLDSVHGATFGLTSRSATFCRSRETLFFDGLAPRLLGH